MGRKEKKWPPSLQRASNHWICSSGDEPVPCPEELTGGVEGELPTEGADGDNHHWWLSLTREQCPRNPEQTIRKRPQGNQEKCFSAAFGQVSIVPKRMSTADTTADMGERSKQMSGAREGKSWKAPQAHSHRTAQREQSFRLPSERVVWRTIGLRPTSKCMPLGFPRFSLVSA